VIFQGHLVTLLPLFGLGRAGDQWTKPQLGRQ
jgi:hypothetical protein